MNHSGELNEIIKNDNVPSPLEEAGENLGLDADHSADEASRLDNDNDMVSHNPDGEDDDHDYNESDDSTPLMDK